MDENDIGKTGPKLERSEGVLEQDTKILEERIKKLRVRKAYIRESILDGKVLQFRSIASFLDTQLRMIETELDDVIATLECNYNRGHKK